jgi:DNA polymerase-1
MKLIFDIEADGLLATVTRLWVLVTIDADTGEETVFFEDDPWEEHLQKADVLIGHNIIGYDLPVLEKLFGFKWEKAVIDTLIMSQTQNFLRFGQKGHSLRVWGEALNFPKGDFEDFTKLSEEMVHYCVNDVKVTKEVFEYLQYESKKIKNKHFSLYLEAEFSAAKWAALSELHGWPFDIEKAVLLLQEMDQKLEDTKNKLEILLGWKSIPGEEKKFNLTKDGFYPAWMARRFDVEPVMGAYYDEDRLIMGPYCNVDFAQRSLNSLKDVKEWLFLQGWEPTEYNYKVVGRERQQMSPKITEDSLEFMGERGRLYLEYVTIRSRASILRTWIEEVSDEKVHGSMMLVGTPSMRGRHSKIANIPSAQATYGKEVRELFKVLPGYKMIGADSSGNQARGLAFALNDPEFIHQIIEGDIHTYNANILSKIVGNEVTRAQAKRILYAFLFGASGGKLWSYIYNVLDHERGQKLKDGFIKAVPGFEKLVSKLNKEYKESKGFGHPFIRSYVGNKIFVDSPHKLLVYYLQALEKITCSLSIYVIMKELKEAGIWYQPLIYYHDEVEFMVREEDAEIAAKIAANAFKKGPEMIGIMIMDGEAKIGDNWYEVH